MATLTFDALWRDHGVANGLKSLATQAAKTKLGFDKLGTSSSLFKRLASSSSQASRAGMSIGTNLQRGIIKPMAGLPGIIAGLVGGAVVMGAKRLATEASDMNETVSKTRTIFGTSSKAIESWSKSAARNLGMSRQQALDGASAFGNLFDQLGFGVKQSTAMSKSFVQMATDAASFNNADPSQVMEAFLSATRGEYDALQKYIPTASAATIEAEAMRMTHKKSTSDLTAADKAAALYQVSVKGLGKATGDFSRTSGAFANQQRIMAANWADLRVKIGTYFLPMFTKAAKYMNEEGFPALTRIVDVLGTIGGAAGRMGSAVLKVFSKTFATAIDGATTNLTEIADWMETHQEKMVRFFIRLGDGALALGRGIVTLAVSSIRRFGDMAAGLATFVVNGGRGIADLLEGMSTLPLIGDEMRDSLKRAATSMRTGSDAAAASLRDTKTKAHEAADAIERKATPAFDKAADALHKVGNEEIWKAKQRDAAARASIAIRDIGTKADGSQIKLKTWNDRTRLGSIEQQRLEGRIKAARTRMLEQRDAGIKAGDSQVVLTKRWNQGREALYREFRQMGLSKEEARQLAIRYSKVPGKVKTKVEAPGMSSTDKAAKDLRKRILDLPHKTVQINFKSNASTLAYNYGIAITRSTARRLADQGRNRNLAGGGVLPGFTPGRDVHEFWSPTAGKLALSGGEAIMRPEWTRMVGGPEAVKRMNAEARGHRFAEGGVFRRITVDTDRFPPRPNFDQLANKYARALGNRLGAMIDAKLEKAASAGGGGGQGITSAPGGFTNFRGGRLTNLAAANLRRAEQIAGTTFRVFQGGWRPRTSYSGTSHAGDAIDTQAAARVIRAIRAVGWASGDRTGLGNWASHAHSVPSPRTGRAGGSAVWQYQDYLRRGGARQSLRSPWGLERGGLLTARVAERGPERILSARQTNAFERMVSHMDRGGGGGTTVHNHYHFDKYIGSKDEIRQFLVEANRHNKLAVLNR